MLQTLKRIPRSVLFYSIGGLFFLVLGIGLGEELGKVKEDNRMQNLFLSMRQIRLANEKYPLVSRLIGTEIPSATEFGVYTDTYTKIKHIVDSAKKDKTLDTFSMYFRDLNSGLWFGVNENEEYIPASLFKLPIAMTYFRDSIDNKDTLTKTFTYTKEIDDKLDTQIGLEKSELTIGNAYTVENLIEKMLIDSDNGAKNLLSENINIKTLNTLFDLIQVDGPKQNNYFISPKEYAFFLRILYNASYLGLERSQKLLEILSKVTFRHGIRDAVPSDITVIHKFGSLNLIDKTTREKTLGFHDCGIVYYPERPFILCFMTGGSDQKELSKLVEEITRYIISVTDIR